jgi:hypothetical protein
MLKTCAYPCVIEDEQFEHPTHGHHKEFRPNGMAPRNMEPLTSAPIYIPLAYMNGDSVEISYSGWNGDFLPGVEPATSDYLETLEDPEDLWAN